MLRKIVYIVSYVYGILATKIRKHIPLIVWLIFGFLQGVTLFYGSWIAFVSSFASSAMFFTMCIILKDAVETLQIDAINQAKHREDLVKEKDILNIRNTRLQESKKELMQEMREAVKKYRLEIHNLRLYAAQLQKTLMDGNIALYEMDQPTMNMPPIIPTVLKSQIDGKEKIEEMLEDKTEPFSLDLHRFGRTP